MSLFLKISFQFSEDICYMNAPSDIGVIFSCGKTIPRYLNFITSSILTSPIYNSHLGCFVGEGVYLLPNKHHVFSFLPIAQFSYCVCYNHSVNCLSYIKDISRCNIGSQTNTAVKKRRSESIPAWVTTREYQSLVGEIDNVSELQISEQSSSFRWVRYIPLRTITIEKGLNPPLPPTSYSLSSRTYNRK